MADITIDPQDPSTSAAGAAPPRPGRVRRTVVLGALALGGILGSAATVAVTDGDAGSRPEAAVRSPESAAVALPAARADAAWGRSTSADALARWAEAERQARVELCTSAPSSADALSRCMGDRG